jgi:hypothetical protein
MASLIEPITPEDQERARLEAILATAFEDGHYHHKCCCQSCTEARHFLSPQDLVFVNRVSEIMASTEHKIY